MVGPPWNSERTAVNPHPTYMVCKNQVNAERAPCPVWIDIQRRCEFSRQIRRRYDEAGHDDFHHTSLAVSQHDTSVA